MDGVPYFQTDLDQKSAGENDVHFIFRDYRKRFFLDHRLAKACNAPKEYTKVTFFPDFSRFGMTGLDWFWRPTDGPMLVGQVKTLGQQKKVKVLSHCITEIDWTAAFSVS